MACCSSQVYDKEFKRKGRCNKVKKHEGRKERFCEMGGKQRETKMTWLWGLSIEEKGRVSVIFLM